MRILKRLKKVLANRSSKKTTNKRSEEGLRFDVVTLFPALFEGFVGESLMARAQQNDLLSVHVHQLRNWSVEPHKSVDDRPFGGGPGMVLQLEPIYRAVQDISARVDASKKKRRTVLFSTRGQKLNAKKAQELAAYDQITFICGRYEGVDERVAQHIADEEISIGDYVLSGGELPAMVTMEAIARFVPGFLGSEASLEERSGSYPVYTRPAEFETEQGAVWSVPDVLLSGHHERIEEWRKRHSSNGRA